MDFGYCDVDTTCPACSASNIIRVFGQDGNTYYRTVSCSTCLVQYGVSTAMTIEGAPTEYELTVPTP